jgi:hypothetical protein
MTHDDDFDRFGPGPGAGGHGDDAFEELPDEAASASCPYCGEAVEILVDPGGLTHQEYVEDCPVCCRPWRVRVDWYDGSAVVVLGTEDE